MSYHKDKTLIVIHFTGGYKPVFMFFMSKMNEKKYWSSSVMIPKHKILLLCESIMDIVKGIKKKFTSRGQVKKSQATFFKKGGKKVIGVRKRRMFLEVEGLFEDVIGNVSIRLCYTSYVILLSTKEAIKFSDSLKQLFEDFKPIKLPRRWDQSTKDQIDNELFEIKKNITKKLSKNARKQKLAKKQYHD